MKHFILGFLIAPIAPFVIFIIGGPLFLAVLMMGSFFVYPAALLLGLPLFLWVKRKPHLQRVSTYIAGGGLIGFVSAIVIYLSFSTEGDHVLGVFVSEVLPVSVYTTLHGAVSGLVFWLYVRPIMRPKKPVSNEALPNA